MSSVEILNFFGSYLWIEQLFMAGMIGMVLGLIIVQIRDRKWK